jgi:hypothetical protein
MIRYYLIRYDMSQHIFVCKKLRNITLRSCVYILSKTNLLICSMKQSPSSEAYRFAASQEISSILWYSKVHYGIHKCPPPLYILSQLNPFQTPICYVFKIHLKIIFPSTPGSPQWSLSPRFPHQNPVHLFPHPIRAIYTANLILLDFITRTIVG